MRFLICAALILCLTSSTLAERPRHVDPSRGSSWTWRPNNPIVIAPPPVRGHSIVRPVLPPPTITFTLPQSGGYSYGYGFGSFHHYGSGPAAQQVIIINPYCN